ncbi:Ubiquitin carboxyl-terminal hydrolase [Thalictrum thalictroides]|uniref:ubiquitinyl hydrolase 1 n=1 Tax=Thalictrum thalictroides TaxID=46969 RepID=A0A7J6VNY7_THATH|nr:Ubiquitin carboxyl-terminal hydrolase [Thalictrum thalictroides]
MKFGGEVNVYSLIHKIKHDGFVLFSSIPQYRVAASVLAASGLILAIKNGNLGLLHDVLLKTFTSDSSENLRFIAGLQNMGNNCFFNVILQALASCDSFHQYLESIVEEDSFSAEEMPLMNVLDSLLQELCILRDKKMALNPQRVMLAMDEYIPSFDLTMQQDAAEAFLHLLSSLRKELSECYVPHHCSLADIYAVSLSRISSPLWEHQSEMQRWQQYLLGPFDGILCSTLVCRSCSSQHSMGFEFFHSLPLSPLLDHREAILEGSSLENCLKKFTAAELIENYRCNQCWHNSAINYVSTIGGNETKVGILKCCNKEDSCNCRNLFPEKPILLSNEFSCTIKQLRIARCPKILCIHLQRASVNNFGEPVKIQGHISFPMILDLFPFTKDAIGVAVENLDENVRMIEKHYQPPNPRFNHLNMQYSKQILQSIYGPAKVISEANAGAELVGSLRTKCAEACDGESQVSGSPSEFTTTSMQSDNKINDNQHLPSKSFANQLVSVVEHFGRVGSGHYTVYRRVKHEPDGQHSGEQWFCVSDAKVFHVSEADVLAAEASLLFYEKIEFSNKLPTIL